METVTHPSDYFHCRYSTLCKALECNQCVANAQAAGSYQATDSSNPQINPGCIGSCIFEADTWKALA